MTSIMNNFRNISSGQVSSEIRSESLQQFLLSLRQRTCLRPSLCIPILDSWITSDDTIYADSPDFPRIIGIDGHSGSGKTHCLYFLLATCILPFEYLSTFVGGWRKAAFVFDMNGHFRISRFRDILFARLLEKLPPWVVPSLAEQYLRRLQIFRPISSEQLAITLKHLPVIHSALFPDLELGIIAIHSTDAFYWLDRFKVEQVRSALASKEPRQTAPNVPDILLSCGATLLITHGTLSKANLHCSPDEFNHSHNKHEIGIHFKNFGATLDSATLPLTAAEFISSRQLLLALHTLQQCDDFDNLQIQGLAQIPGHAESLSFDFCVNRQGRKIRSL